MLRQTGQSVGFRPYAIGGDRDVRRRAVTAIAAIERTVQVVERELKARPRMGRRIRLRYHKRYDHFEWRWWEAARRTSALNGGMQDGRLQTMRPSTRAKVEGMQRILGVRAAGRAVLRLTEWMVKHGQEWTEQTVTLRWAWGEYRRAIWGAMLSGGSMRRGNVRPWDGVESGYAPVVERFNVGREPQGWRGEVTEGVKSVVEEIRRIDERLTALQRQLQGYVRVYYATHTDVWMVRMLFGPKRSRHVTNEAGRRLVGKVPEVERSVLEEVLEGIERRKRLKRVLRLVAVLGEAARQWPGGRWQLRGERGTGQAAAWVATATGRGMSVIEDGAAVGQRRRGEKLAMRNIKEGMGLVGEHGERCNSVGYQ